MQVNYTRDVTYKVTLELTAKEAGQISNALMIGTNHYRPEVRRAEGLPALPEAVLMVDHLFTEIADRAEVGDD